MKEKYITKECKHHGLTSYVFEPNRNCYRCKQCRSAAVSNKRRQLKQKALSYKGSCCSICGYYKCTAALEFHHQDDTKEFTISSGDIKSWDKMKIELDKCILVCANCHRELHHI